MVLNEFKIYDEPELRLHSIFVWIISFGGDFHLSGRLPAILVERFYS